MKDYFPLIFLFLILIAYSNNSFPNIPIAEIIFLKGQVTHLNPGARTALKTKLKDKIQEGTSIVTGKKSIVRIKYISDGSIVTLGQNGKLLIEKVKNKKAGIINLMVGKLRTNISKNKKSKNKFFIKTRTAALGVRGTDFYTVYNPQNQVTSLITFEGKVAMKKFVKKRGIVDSADAAKHIESSSKSLVENLSQALESPGTVIVKKGRYSGVSSNFLKSSKPVKISPKQFLALKKNDLLEEASEERVKKVFSKEEIKLAAKEINQVDVIDPEKEGFYNEKTGDFAPKSGGYLDGKTGIYVQPSNNSQFNKDLDNFEADQNIGSIDDMGNYHAPPGLVLTASSGFTPVIQSSQSKEEVKDLNKTIATAIPIKEKEEVIEKTIKERAKKQVEKTANIEKKESWIDRHFFAIYLGPSHILSEIDSPPPSQHSSNLRSSLESSSGKSLELLWSQNWNKKIETVFTMGYAKYKFDSDKNGFYPITDSEDLIKLSMNFRYWYTSWMAFRFGLRIEDFYLSTMNDFGKTNEYFYVEMKTGKIINPGIDFQIFNTKSFDLSFSVSFLLYAPEKVESTTSKINDEPIKARGMNLRLDSKFRIFKNKFISLYIDHRHAEFDHKMAYTDSNNNTNLQQISSFFERTDIGIGFSFEI